MGSAKSLGLLLLFLFTLILSSGSMAAGTQTQGEVVVFVSDAEDNYPHAGVFNNVLTQDSYYNDQYDDSFNIQDFPSSNPMQVNMFDDAGNFGEWYEDAGVCGLLMFDHDPSSSEDGAARYYPGAHVSYDGVWPDSGSNFEGTTFEDGNDPTGEGTAENLFNDLTGTGYNGQSIDGNTGNMELIRGPNDWRLKGDLLCGDHRGNGQQEWKMCTSSETDGDFVFIGGQQWACDGSQSRWVENDEPYAFFSVDDANGDGTNAVGETLTFDASSSFDDKSIEKYLWDFNGDGAYEVTNDFSDTETHSFSSPGAHTVRLQVIDEYGLADTYERTVDVSDECLYGEDVGNGFDSIYRDYGFDTDYGYAEAEFTIDHNQADCPQPDELRFNVCDHSLGEEYIRKGYDYYEISFNVPRDVPCGWGTDGQEHHVNLTMASGSNIEHDETELHIYAKGRQDDLIADPNKGYYIYIEQNVHNSPNNFSGMWLTNQTWYDCDGSCGITPYNRYPDTGTASERNIDRGAKFMVKQSDETVPDGSRPETGVYHAQYGAIIENQTGNSISNYISEPDDSAEGENCGNGECWWLGNSYSDLQTVLNQQFTESLTETFTEAAVIY